MTRVSVDNMATEIMNGLKEYEKLSREEIKKAVKKVGKDTVEKLKTTSPRRTGSYASEWKVKDVSPSADKFGVVVYNNKYYYMTHWLEKGHALWQGGRISGKPHIAPAQAFADEEVTRLIEAALR